MYQLKSRGASTLLLSPPFLVLLLTYNIAAKFFRNQGREFISPRTFDSESILIWGFSCLLVPVIDGRGKFDFRQVFEQPDLDGSVREGDAVMVIFSVAFYDKTDMTGLHCTTTFMSVHAHTVVLLQSRNTTNVGDVVPSKLYRPLPVKPSVSFTFLVWLRTHLCLLAQVFPTPLQMYT